MQIGEIKEVVKKKEFRFALMDVFFEAMNEGYVSHPKKGTITEIPGSKTITYGRVPWYVIDTYVVTPLGSRSGGTTVISYDGVPVWMMQYFGEYAEEAIPCLKAALRAAYEEKEFRCGRGPRSFKHEGFMYENFPEDLHGVQPYLFFNGKEEICELSPKRELRGWHRYQGGLMI